MAVEFARPRAVKELKTFGGRRHERGLIDRLELLQIHFNGFGLQLARLLVQTPFDFKFNPNADVLKLEGDVWGSVLEIQRKHLIAGDSVILDVEILGTAEFSDVPANLHILQPRSLGANVRRHEHSEGESRECQAPHRSGSRRK
jgi:hypothetical protein